MKRLLAVIAVLVVACTGTAAIPLLSVACWRGQISPWLVWCAAPLVIVAMALTLRRLLPLTKRFVPEDGSLPWREFRAVRRLELLANGEEDVSLVLELVRDRLDEAAVAVRFDGVSDLSMRQLGNWAVFFDGLVVEVLPEPGGDDARFAIRDAHEEWISFRCRRLESIPS